MTHYTINFATFPEELRPFEALKEIISYVGKDRFVKFTNDARHDIVKGLTLEQFAFAVSFAGVQGMPARVWYNYCKHDLCAEGAEADE